MQKIEQNMLCAALVSWVVTHVLDALPTVMVGIKNLTWEKSMKHLNEVIQLAVTLVENTVCSSVIVVGVCLEWLAHEARAVGMFGNQLNHKRAPLRGFALSTSHSAIIYSQNWAYHDCLIYVEVKRDLSGLFFHYKSSISNGL